MIGLVKNLLKPIKKISNDERYQLLDQIKSLILIPNPELIQSDEKMMKSMNWRLMILLNFVTSQATESHHHSRLLDHMLGYFEDLMYEDAGLDSQLASLSLNVLKKHLSQSPAFINKEAIMFH